MSLFTINTWQTVCSCQIAFGKSLYALVIVHRARLSALPSVKQAWKKSDFIQILQKFVYISAVWVITLKFWDNLKNVNLSIAKQADVAAGPFL